MPLWLPVQLLVQVAEEQQQVNLKNVNAAS